MKLINKKIKMLLTYVGIFFSISTVILSSLRADIAVEGFYRLGESGLAKDSSDHGRNLSSFSDGKIGEINPLSEGNPEGNKYVGSVKYLSGPSAMFLDKYQLPHDNFGIELYARVSDLDAAGALLSTAGGISQRGVEIFYDGTGVLGRGIGFTAALSGVDFVGQTVSVNDTSEWVYLALVCADGKTTFYVNGKAVGTQDRVSFEVDAKDVIIIGGRSGGLTPFFGDIDEVRLFTFASGKFREKDLLFYSKFEDKN
jgi:hypothetical protein